MPKKHESTNRPNEHHWNPTIWFLSESTKQKIINVVNTQEPSALHIYRSLSNSLWRFIRCQKQPTNFDEFDQKRWIDERLCLCVCETIIIILSIWKLRVAFRMPLVAIISIFHSHRIDTIALIKIESIAMAPCIAPIKYLLSWLIFFFAEAKVQSLSAVFIHFRWIELHANSSS